MWLKYSDAPILTGEYWDRNQQPDDPDDDYHSSYDKPRGCWITDDTEHCWREWCVGEQFMLDTITHKHEVVLDESRILILRSPGELDRFTHKYGKVCRWGPGRSYRHLYIDWPQVAAEHTGLIITPYQWQRRMELNWYYTWDCASGCIWDVSAIREIRLIEINHEIAKPREAEAA